MNAAGKTKERVKNMLYLKLGFMIFGYFDQK